MIAEKRKKRVSISKHKSKMKKVNLNGKLELKKEAISNLHMNEINGGGKTLNYSECGTGPATIICCATVVKTQCNTVYAICGTGPQTLDKVNC